MADEVDDYMTMTFGDGDVAAAPKKETSLQRRLRLQRQGRERGRIPSKAELARTAEQEREAALSRSLIPAKAPAAAATAAPGSKGLAMMARMGFVAGQALGKQREAGGSDKGGEAAGDTAAAATEPIRIRVKRDRGGIGLAEEPPTTKKAKSGSADAPEASIEMDPIAYRDRIRQEREAERLERQVHAAQVVAERMDAQETEGRALKAINVRWRGLVRDRRRAEQDRQTALQARRRLDASLRGRPDEEDEDDEDDRVAAGKAPAASFLATGLKTTEVHTDDEDEEDGDNNDDDDDDDELAAFLEQPPQERLQQIVDWMRAHHRYCFWCKHGYDDDALDGCPGPTEADHD